MKAWLPPGALVLVVLVMLPAQAEPKPFPDLVPAMLKIKYDHDMGSCTDVEWDQGRITVTQSMGGSPVPAIRPTLNDRTKFIRALNQARIYQWSNHYGPRFRWAGTETSVGQSICSLEIGSFIAMATPDFLQTPVRKIPIPTKRMSLLPRRSAI